MARSAEIEDFSHPQPLAGARIFIFIGGARVRAAKLGFLSGVFMPVSRSRFTVIFSLLLFLCLSSASVFAGGKRKPKVPAKQEQPAPPPVEARPPAELTLEQKSAVPPQVTYENRRLTIVAENSTLGDILRAVKAKTGASIDLPPNANSRVVGRFGPGPSRDVLATLLNGTLFNYVLLGTANDPTAVGKIILTPKPTGPEQQAVAVNNPAQPYVQQNYYPNANVPDQSSDDVAPDSDNEAEQPPPTDESQQPGTQPNGQANPKTPEQLLQELQRQQLLQQMQRQQQGNQAPGQNPEQ